MDAKMVHYTTVKRVYLNQLQKICCDSERMLLAILHCFIRLRIPNHTPRRKKNSDLFSATKARWYTKVLLNVRADRHHTDSHHTDSHHTDHHHDRGVAALAEREERAATIE